MIEETLYEDKSNSRIIQELGERFRDYRMYANLTQKEVAQKAGISIFTLSQFERGASGNITLNSFLTLLRGLGLLKEFSKVLPELPPVPGKIYNNKKKRERVRHG